MEMCARMGGGTNLVLVSRNTKKIGLFLSLFFYVFIAQTIGIVLPHGFSVRVNVVHISLGIGNYWQLWLLCCPMPQLMIVSNGPPL